MGAAGSTPISSALLPPPPAAMFSGLLTVSVNMKTHFLKEALSTHHVSCRHPGDVRSGSGFCDGANVHGAVCECLMSKQPNVNPCTGETQGVHSTAIFCFSLTNMWVCVPVDNNWPPSRTSCSVHGAHTHTHTAQTQAGGFTLGNVSKYFLKNFAHRGASVVAAAASAAWFIISTLKGWVWTNLCSPLTTRCPRVALRGHACPFQ